MIPPVAVSGHWTGLESLTARGRCITASSLLAKKETTLVLFMLNSFTVLCTEAHILAELGLVL